MTIIINTSTNNSGGGLQVSISLIEECKNIKGHEYHIFMNSNITSSLNIKQYPSNFHFYEIPKLKFYKYQNYLSNLENKINPDIVFSVFGPTYWRPKSLHIMGFAMGHYIYPDSPYWKIISLKDRLFWYLKKKIHMYYFKRDADGFIAETKDAALRVQRIFNKRCDVVSNTCNQYFNDFLNKDINNYFLPPKTINEYRLLSVCTPYLHKNLQIIPKVLDILSLQDINSIVFILTIDENEYNKLVETKYRNNIKTIGKIKPSKVPQIYAECDFAFVPSLLECFTANFPEAMKMKKPILAADLDYAHSICEQSAIYFNPLLPEDIADKILCLIKDVKLQEKLIHNGILQLNKFKTATERAFSYIEILEQYRKDNIYAS